MGVAFGTYFLVHFASGAGFAWQLSGASRRWAIPFGLLFLAACDYWQWSDHTPMLLGLPGWVWYFVGLSALQTLLMWRMCRAEGG
jgi:hypothetical protein